MITDKRNHALEPLSYHALHCGTFLNLNLEIATLMQSIPLANGTKAELLQEGIFFPHPFICMRNFINKKVENRRN